MPIIARLKIALANRLARLVPWTVDIPDHLRPDRLLIPELKPEVPAPGPHLRVIEGGKGSASLPTYPRSCRRSCNAISASERRIG